MQPGVREHRHDLAVQKRPARLAVQQQHRFALGRPGFREGQPQVADVGVVRGIAVVRQVSETVVGGAERLHPAMLSRKGTRPQRKLASRDGAAGQYSL